MGRNRKAAGPRCQVSVSLAGDLTIARAAIQSKPTGLRRSTLLGTVAAGMLLFGYGRSAQAQVVPPAAPCNTVSGSTVTCTGNVSAGIAIDQVGAPADTFSTLNVNGVTRDIAPASMIDGIYFGSDGNVTINSDTGPFSITTTGDNADGIEAYSYNGNVKVTHAGDIITRGDYARGIYADGVASTIVDHTGDITTRGYGSEGIYATGYGRVSVKQTGTITTQGVYSDGIYATAFGGPITVNQTGSIVTHGDGAMGINAFSPVADITVNQTGNITTHGDGSYGIGAFSPSGNITVRQTGNITTHGYDANGITAISYGGDVTVKQTGNITTSGHYAYGISAFTLGGALAISHTGTIRTSGRYADGIYAEICCGGPIRITQSGDITVTGSGSDAIDVNAGYGRSVVIIKRGSTITGGPDSGDGVDFDGGITNRLINHGTITTMGENAIEGEGPGAEIVDNHGTVTGNVDLGPGANRFNNESGGLFNTGTTAFIGDGNLLHNAGTLSPGGAGKVRTTALTGNMVQTSGGSFAVDLNLGNATTDRVNVSGTAKLDGTVKVAVQNPALLNQKFVILSADGGTTDNGLGLLASPALQASLLFPNPNDVVLDIDVDFAPDGLNRNQTAIGNNLNQVLGAGGGTLGPVFGGLFNVFTLNAYADALDQLSPEIYADTEIAALYSAFDFSDNLLSCHVNGAETAAINSEGQCLWVGGKGGFIDGENTFQDLGFDETAAQFAGGAQFALNPVWRLGFGAGYQASTLQTDTLAESEGDQLQGGVALKYNPGALLLAGVLSGGHGWYDTTRPMAFGGFAETARADHEIDILQGRLHASYVLGNPGLYYKPMLDAAVTEVTLDDVRETGAGGASLLVRGDNHTVFSLSPALEVGTEWWFANGTLVRPFLRGGLTWYSEDDVTVSASFLGAPSGVAPFAIAAATDEVQADVAAGIEMIDTEDSALRIFYDGQFGDRLAVHAGGIKASVRF